jgi:catechol 2,3-dioxygenase-like lactoylglutathione lyase family enzyme
MTMSSTPTANSPARYFGPFGGAPSLGIDRANYIAIQSKDPAAAARYAVEHMGFYLVHADKEGRHYLGAHGLDPYSLVYTPGEQGAVDHISYVVRTAADLPEAETRLAKAKVKTERVERSSLWRHGPALRFKNPSGQTIELTPGVNVDVPMAALVAEPSVTPGPISLDHAVVRCVDVGGGFEFASRAMGLKESARIVAPDGIPVLGFFRCHTVFHCYAVARSQYNGLHHMQFTLKNPLAVHAAFEQMRDRGKVEIIWGPLRHGAGHNIVFYFRDYSGNIVEYSAEEEIILNDATYVPRAWPVTDPRAGDEWNLSPIPAAMM